MVTFYHDERLLKPLSMGGTNYFVVGDDYGTVLGINLETDELWAVDPNEQLPQCFVNSRVSDFVLFLALWESRQPDLEEATTEGIKGIIRQLRWQFNSRDKHALENVVNWWNDVLNDVIRSLRE